MSPNQRLLIIALLFVVMFGTPPLLIYVLWLRP